MQEFNVEKIINDAENIGISTGLIISNIIESSSHPLKHLRRCLGIIRLGSRYTKELLEYACEELIKFGVESPRYAEVEEVIKAKILKTSTKKQVNRQPNKNLRGQHTWGRR